jgi:hypothetical protein
MIWIRATARFIRATPMTRGRCPQRATTSASPSRTSARRWQIERGIQPISGPTDVPDIGQRFAFITDNCGNIIELTEPGGPRS